MDTYIDRGTPSKGRRRSSGFNATTILLAAAVILGLFSVGIVGFAMHPLLHEERAGGRRRGTLPGEEVYSLPSPLTRSKEETEIDDSQAEEEGPPLRPGCRDRSPKCKLWASEGQCGTNAGYMYENCLASCQPGGCDAVYLHNVTESVTLHSGQRMPTVGFGTAALGEDTERIVAMALKEGYRRLDSAQAREWYREDLLGAAVQSSGIPREQIFITTKVHPRDLGVTATPAAIQRSLKDLGTAYLDLVLLHYPECWGDLCDGAQPEGTWKDSWAALENLVDKRVIRCLGVSNFAIDQLAELLKIAKIKPCLVQSNYEPLRPARALQAFCKQNGIQFESYSTLGGQYGTTGKNPVLKHAAIVALAGVKQRSPAQIVLRWALQLGQTVVPRTANLEHMKENAALFDFDLSDEEMSLIEALGVTRGRNER